MCWNMAGVCFQSGGSALETVEQCTLAAGGRPGFQCGAGSVLNEAGKVEMDAAIMCGAHPSKQAQSPASPI